MSCCCTKTYKFCKPVNGCNGNNFATMFTALADGSYIVNLDYLGAVLSVPITVLDNVVTLPDNFELNEDYTYTGQVISSAGGVVPIIVETVEYDCFQFETKLFV